MPVIEPSGVAVPPAAPPDTSLVVPGIVPVTVGGFLAWAGRGKVVGWSFVETTGAAAARFDIFDGTSANGQLVATVQLGAGLSTPGFPGCEGYDLTMGLFVNVLAGSVRGCAWIRVSS